jgi:hypothetical protein
MVENGTSVLTRMFGSMVGTGVSVGGGTVIVGVAVSGTGVGVPGVGVQGRGWKGVGEAVGFGGTVTQAKGTAACSLVCADARLPHPVRRKLATNKT